MKEQDSSKPRAASGSALAGAQDQENRDRKRPSGKGVEAVNPTVEADYWRANYAQRPYAAGRTYDELEPAYRYGWESRVQHPERSWQQAESDLARGWDTARGTSNLRWNEAKNATQDAWNRVTNNVQEDSYWRENYGSRPYATNRKYEDLQPAYQYGWQARERYSGRRFDDVEGDLRSGWERTKDAARFRWEEVKVVVRDAFDRNPDVRR